MHDDNMNPADEDKATRPEQEAALTTTATATATTNTSTDIHYFTGFGNTFESEILPGALPLGRNNPRRVPYNLYAEQLSGTAFTAPRYENRRIWLYRIQPSVVVVVVVEPAVALHTQRPRTYFGACAPSACSPVTTALRWKPFPGVNNSTTTTETTTTDFVSGTKLVAHGGDSPTSSKNGLAIYMYSFQKSMKETNKVMYNADGDFLIVPQSGTLHIVTEMGKLVVEPCEICVIPRGIVFQINWQPPVGDASAAARGYMLETYKGGFQLPELGPIGSNGLANARDFSYPQASCTLSKSEYEIPHQIIVKMDSCLSEKISPHSPFNVVAWHGNYLPYKYDLRRFCAVNSVTYDHLDPSIYTVLTCPSDHPGTALADFVIFPPRVMATDENTFRPPWFHRNTMSEFMGLIRGKYDAKADGFVEGGASLHNCMTPHGPDSDTYARAVADPCLAPTKFDCGLAFMFETYMPLRVAPHALDDREWRDMAYTECWQGLSDIFTGWGDLEAMKEH